MHDREENIKRSQSQTNPTRKESTMHRALSQETEKTCRKSQEDFEGQALLDRVLERLPPGQTEWTKHSFEQKNCIPGYKSKLEWHQSSRDLRALFKVSYTTNFFTQIGTIVEGDVIVELQEINFELSQHQKRSFQEKIEQILIQRLQVIKSRGFGQQWRRQNEYLRSILLQLDQELKKVTLHKRKVSRSQKIEQRQLNTRHILYPAPATFTWNPLGSLCITENSFPIVRKPLIGQPSSLRKYFQAGCKQKQTQTNDDQQGVHLHQSGKIMIYDWKVEEEVSLIIFNRQQNAKINQYSISRSLPKEQVVSKAQDGRIGSENIDLGTLLGMPAKLRRAYQRYFGEQQLNVQFHRHDKLKVYDILSLSQQDEDDIVFLIERINSRPLNTFSTTVAFRNHFSMYPSLLNTPIDRMRYDILAKQLREDISNSKLSFGAFLRMFVLENQFFSRELQRYFKQQYRILGLRAHPQLYGLGSYCKFDRVKAQMLFMDVIKCFLGRNAQISRQKSSGIRVRRRPVPCRLSIDPVVNDEQKDSFLRLLFPLLIVKDREMQRFEFKKIKQIVSANACMLSYLKKLNQLVIKYQQGHTQFLKTVVDQYFIFRSDLKDQTMEPHRYFIQTCSNCHKVTYFYNLPTSQDAQFCQRCKARSISDII